MKYIKINVPDNFDPTLGDLSYIAEDEKIICPVWQPIYRNVLDRGYIGLIDHLGDDHSVVRSARISYGTGTKRVSEDRNLIRYLMKHQHWSPFEFPTFQWHVKAPIFVMRQTIRHRTFSVNEYSARYSVLDDTETYMPEINILKPQSKDNKQGRAGELSYNNAYASQLQLQHIYQECSQAYHYLLGDTQVPSTALNTRYDIIKQFALEHIKRLEQTDPNWKPELVTEEMIDEKIKEIVVANGLAFTDDEFWGEDGEGLSRELARIGLTLGTYTQWYWQSNLRNLLHFISLRSTQHAQYEVREYSDAMLEMIKPIVPNCVEAFLDYQMHGKSLSRMELEVIRQMYSFMDKSHIDVQELIQETMTNMGAGKREIREFLETLEGK
jgi:thymidylate synthase (FAD)